MENDIQGIVRLEILSATDLPKIKNGASPFPTIYPLSGADRHLVVVMHTSWDMNPFVVVSFGKKASGRA
jgi:hypothetical protein